MAHVSWLPDHSVIAWSDDSVLCRKRCVLSPGAPNKMILSAAADRYAGIGSPKSASAVCPVQQIMN